MMSQRSGGPFTDPPDEQRWTAPSSPFGEMTAHLRDIIMDPTLGTYRPLTAAIARAFRARSDTASAVAQGNIRQTRSIGPPGLSPPHTARTVTHAFHRSPMEPSRVKCVRTDRRNRTAVPLYHGEERHRMLRSIAAPRGVMTPAAMNDDGSAIRIPAPRRGPAAETTITRSTGCSPTIVRENSAPSEWISTSSVRT